MATFRIGLQFVNFTVTRCHQSISTAVLLPKFSWSIPQMTSPTSALSALKAPNSCCSSLFHTTTHNTSYRNTEFEDRAPKQIGRAKLEDPDWLKYNDVIYPPTEPGEPERPAEICHSRFQIKYSTKKLWYTAVMVRGMSIDEAIKQLSFHKRKGAAHIKETLEEAQEMAVRDHNVEFKSNLWIADSFVEKGIIIKGMRKHARGRYGVIHYRYTNYFVRLREGKPPTHYYPPDKTGNELMADYIKKQRERSIPYGL